jgi:bla regulator protein BlaR1
MALSTSVLLQALGWATLNSFWQMALLWCLYLVVSHFFRISSNQRYLLAAYSVFAGSGWFLFTLVSFYTNGHSRIESLPFATLNGLELLPRILTAASVTYLVLLIVPTYKVFRNWRFLQVIKREGLRKADLAQRLFVQRIAGQIGIRKQVQVFLSDIVMSPVTIGYIKPLILVPVAALGNLSPAQLEAILLHELSHIRRHDYLVNLLLTAVHVLLYFNPFVKLFIRAVEMERENCCDELVLQFEYDKVSYASALLQLQKTNHRTPVLAMGAASRSHLLNRIEKIVGIQRKARLNASHILGAFGALLLLLTINSMIIAGRQRSSPAATAGSLISPYSYFANADRGDILFASTKGASSAPRSTTTAPAPTQTGSGLTVSVSEPVYEMAEDGAATENAAFHTVAFDEDEAKLTEEQKQQVTSAVSKTKKALQTNWYEVQRLIPDGIVAAEQEAVRSDYMKQVERVNWQRMEESMKAGYETIDWERVFNQLANQAAVARLDSVTKCYEVALAQMTKLKTSASKVERVAIPDASLKELRQAELQLKKNITELKNIRAGKVIKL